MNITVIGMGYVGIPCAALLADVGWRLPFPSPASSAAPSAPAGRSKARVATELSCSYTTPGVEYYWWGVN